MEKCTIEEGSPSQLTWCNTLNIIPSKGIIKKKFQEVAVQYMSMCDDRNHTTGTDATSTGKGIHVV